MTSKTPTCDIQAQNCQTTVPPSNDRLPKTLDGIRRTASQLDDRYRLMGSLTAALMTNGALKSIDEAYRKERLDLIALCQLTLLDDWFMRKYLTLEGMTTLANMHEFHENNPDFKSSFDLICLQILEGIRYVPAREAPCRGTGKKRKLYQWEESTFARKYDGARPGKIGGLTAEEDFTAKLYLAFKAQPTHLQQQSVRDLKTQLERLASNPSSYDGILEEFEKNFLADK